MGPKQIKQLYEIFYSKTHQESYFLDLSNERNQKFIENFFINLGDIVSFETIGPNLLIDYFAFAFYYYSSLETKRNITFNWIIGKKMIKRFFEREKGWDYYVDNFLRENQINTDTIRSKLVEEKQEKNYLAIHQEEELEKARCADTEARVYSCLNTTTLYNHRSHVCLLCHQKQFCKQLLKKVNPSLYENRGYGATDQS
jgi:hypothetical protein